MMLLDVVDIYVNDGAVEGRRIDPAALDAIGRLGGDYYAGTRERFELERPMVKGVGRVFCRVSSSRSYPRFCWTGGR